MASAQTPTEVIKIHESFIRIKDFVSMSLCLVVIVGCSAPAVVKPHAAQGVSLVASGPQMNGGLVVEKGRVGHTYRFAFPIFSNNAAKPVTIVDYHWQASPKGIAAGHTYVFDANSTEGIALAYRDGENNGIDLSRVHDYSGRPLVLAPKKESSLYAMLSFKVVTRTNKVFSGCVVDYREGGDLFTQVFQCHVALQLTGLPPPSQ